MNKIKAIIAGGPPAVLAAGGTIMYAQHEVHYLLRPSVVETLAGIAALGGAVIWAKNKKTPTPAPAQNEQERSNVIQGEAWQPAHPQTALPPSQPQQQPFTTDQTNLARHPHSNSN